jgi:hypothetical protein
MAKMIKRVTDLRHLAVIFGLTILFVFINNQKVSAEVQNDNPYLIKVNRIFNTITVYEKDDSGKYTMPIKAMLCSVGEKGTETTVGTFQTKAKYRWKELMGKVFGQYSTRIVGGILFHSVYYYENGNPGSLASREYNKLGSAASHGCIRLSVADAKWIYDNCPLATTVVVYDDKKSPGPLGKPEAVKIPSTVRWDPTDPSTKNPYASKKPTLSGLKNISISWGDEINLLKGIKAKSSTGVNITSKIKVDGKVNQYIAGNYVISYSVKDELGNKAEQSITVSVKKSPEAPYFEGIEDKVFKEGTKIDKELAMEGVNAYCADVVFDYSEVDVTIDKITEDEYYITYQVDIGKNVSTTEAATFYIDREAPVFSGISEKLLIAGQIPDQTLALLGVTVTDNHTELEPSDISISIDENTDGSYLITYAAEDEVGNVTKESSLFHY